MKSIREGQEIQSPFYSIVSFCIREMMFGSLWDYNSSIHRQNMDFLKKIVKKNMKRPMEMASLWSEDYDVRNYEMNSDELRRYNLAQLKEIKKYKKYLEETESKEYAIEEVINVWANKYSASFRKYWHLKNLIDII